MRSAGVANRLIMLGSLSGFATIAIGAFGAHALEGVLNAHHMRNVYETGVQYQMMHTLLLFSSVQTWWTDTQMQKVLHWQDTFFSGELSCSAVVSIFWQSPVSKY